MEVLHLMFTFDFFTFGNAPTLIKNMEKDADDANICFQAESNSIKISF